ncbi:MAG TPA: YkgJ family cysteine cluster protein [Acidimicrobiales bacterium]|nr:YkgJ family cysteine cluster protein [Acidimicrobiales bacterium]
MVDDGGVLTAGPFSDWLTAMRAVLADGGSSDVPCDGCTACCTSSQFVHIDPDETDTLAAIPEALLFPAPGLPVGHLVLGYDERGHCPMLADGACSIYDHRPRTCRTYDCRVFAAAGIDADPARPLILERARRWRFDYPTLPDREEHDAVLAAARSTRGSLPGADPTRIALQSIGRS